MRFSFSAWTKCLRALFELTGRHARLGDVTQHAIGAHETSLLGAAAIVIESRCGKLYGAQLAVWRQEIELVVTRRTRSGAPLVKTVSHRRGKLVAE